jgi:periplasmic protein TonB
LYAIYIFIRLLDVPIHKKQVKIFRKHNAEQTIDDILFTGRNRDYGSYVLRKNYYSRLAISFLIALTIILLISFGYFWYLNSAGDESVYLFSSSGNRLKSTEGSLMSPGELEAYMNSASKPDENKAKQQTSADFTVVDHAVTDTFIIAEAESDTKETEEDIGLGEDSAMYGGYLHGTGEGNGLGSRIDRMPEFPMGNPARYVEINLRYPAQAIKQKIHGIVIVSFVINKNGDVVNVQIEKGVNPIIDAEALKTIQGMPRWKPGILHGRPINIQFRMPINFMPLS